MNIATDFSAALFFVYCSQLFGERKDFFKALHTAITDAVYCVRLVVCDRRVANKRRKGLDKALHKSYNTTPAEEEKPLRWEIASLLSKADFHIEPI